MDNAVRKMKGELSQASVVNRTSATECTVRYVVRMGKPIPIGVEWTMHGKYQNMKLKFNEVL